MQFLLSWRALLSLITNQTKARFGIKPVAFSPALVIAISILFSFQLIQINQRSIEIVGMASWHQQAFGFKAESLTAYSFPRLSGA
ncbi:hypothetical protein [Pantoea sp. AS142]|uniref:hypothetical protein n=1 Tax=Pantoea sp. AS142 TaxID=3081292 RepID=UPI0030190862